MRLSDRTTDDEVLDSPQGEHRSPPEPTLVPCHVEADFGGHPEDDLAALPNQTAWSGNGPSLRGGVLRGGATAAPAPELRALPNVSRFYCAANMSTERGTREPLDLKQA